MSAAPLTPLLIKLLRRAALCAGIYWGLQTPLLAQQPATPLPAGQPSLKLARAKPSALANALKDDAEVLPNVALTRELMFSLLASELALQNGQVGSAYRTYMSLAKQTKDPRLARRATEIAFSAGQQGDALDSARLWAELSPQSNLPKQVVQSLLVALGRWDEVPPLLHAQLDRVPEAQRGEAILALQQQLGRFTKTTDVVKVLSETLGQDMHRPETHLALARAKFLADDKAGAQAALDEALKLNPNLEAALLLSSELEETPRATRIQRLQAYLRQHPQARDVRLQLAKLYIGGEQYEAAEREFAHVQRSSPKDEQVAMALALLSLQRQHFDEAEQRFKHYLTLTEHLSNSESSQGNHGLVIPGRNAAFQYLAELAAKKQDYAAADAWLKKVDDPEQQLAAQVKRAQLLVNRGQLSEALALIAEVRQSPRIQNDAALARALDKAEVGLLTESKAYAQALEKLDALSQRYPDDTDVRIEAAVTLERLGRYNEMETRLQTLIKAQPDNANALNTLGYSWADRNIRLPEALTLLEKAVRLAPDNGMILDSLGWVKYRLGLLEEAEKILATAYSMKAEADIGAHWGEVLWQLGNFELAKTAWRGALKVDEQNEVLRETLQRLWPSGLSQAPQGKKATHNKP